MTDAALVIDDGRVAGRPFRRGAERRRGDRLRRRRCHAGFVDSHAHLVFAGDRSVEFAARMAGQPYAAGGIRTTVAATRAASDEELRARVAHLVGNWSAKDRRRTRSSPAGLTTPDEARSLRIAAEFTDETTFLGAHVVPPEFDGDRPDTSTWCAATCWTRAPHARGPMCSAIVVPSTPTRPPRS